jgi:2,3-bisphosphoglycerate-independent phosphoglycerate mutase
VREAIEKSYASDKSDEFVEPVSIAKKSRVSDGDQIICYNFRADRARELTSALAMESFSGFARPRLPKIGYVCMTEYDRSFNLPIAFGPEELKNTLAEVFAREKIRNIRIAETEKYAHVTYFLNGGCEKPFPCEDRALIPSAKVATYDLEPTMRAHEIAERAAAEIASGNVDVIVINFANPDMVGHTGKLNETVKAIEATDAALGIVIDALAKRQGAALITADHGNAEFMADPATGQAHTAHTTYPVPLVLYDDSYKGGLKDGALYDVAPTFLAMLGIAKPPEMTGSDLRVTSR